MITKMPRGAIPTPRSELAASEPYRPEAGAEIFVPSGAFPTPNHELAAAQPYKAAGAAPASFIAWPLEIGAWGNEQLSNSSWAEEAFAKACAEPKVLIPDRCGPARFAGMRLVEFRRVHANARVSNGPQGLFGRAVQFGRLDERGGFERRHRRCRTGEDRRRLGASRRRPCGPSHTWDERLGDLRPPDGPA
jgi:hypothetical protein